MIISTPIAFQICEFKDQLLFSAGVPSNRILEYSCGHVIPSDHLMPIALARGSSGQELDFTYQSRERTDMVGTTLSPVYAVALAIGPTFLYRAFAGCRLCSRGGPHSAILWNVQLYESFKKAAHIIVAVLSFPYIRRLLLTLLLMKKVGFAYRYRPIFTHIDKTDILVSVLLRVPIYRPICVISVPLYK